MSLTAAVNGFIVFLLSVSVIPGQDGWGVTYTSTKICALKGSTVNIRCSYRYPPRINNLHTVVEKTFWFTEHNVDLKTNLNYSDRVQYDCKNNYCTLRISDLRESDSADYKFRFITNQPGGTFFGNPGVSLSVTDLQVKVSQSKVNRSLKWAELKCQSSCHRPGHYYIWKKNGVKKGEKVTYSDVIDPADNISCAVRGYEDFPSPSVYAPKLPSVSVSPSGEIMEGSSVTLTCSSDANPAAKYTWYKHGKQSPHFVGKKTLHVFNSIQSSDSGEYYCEADNKLGTTSRNISINVKYAPKLPSVSMSPSGEIMEGRSVTLTCSSDANPAANYTWYKENQTPLPGPEGSYHFSSISSKDRGNYYCRAENQHGRITSSSLSVDVQYAPKLPSVSVSPSAEIMEGSSVNLTCSSDANPAANYTWYKENEDSSTTSGPIFTITDFRAEHSGNYICEAQNNRGRQNSALYLTVVAGTGKLVASGTIAVVLLAVIFLSVFLCVRKKRASGNLSEPEERADNREREFRAAQVSLTAGVTTLLGQPEQQGDLQYASVKFTNKQTDPLASNITPVRPLRQTEQQEVVQYGVVKFNRALK